MHLLHIVAPKLMLIGGSLMCIAGFIGNILNICVFTVWTFSPKNFRRFVRFHQTTSNCSLYLLIASCMNLIVIIYPLTTRILFDAYNYTLLSKDAILLCKIRYFVLHTCDLFSLACICLATFDRYLISSRNVRLRKRNISRNQTFYLLLFIITLISLHSLPIIFYYDVSENGQCIIISSIYGFYYLYVFQILLHSLIPMIFLSIFGLLTLRQLKQIGRYRHNQIYRNRDKQLSRMLILISIAIVLSSLPYSIEQLYYVLLLDEKNHVYSSHFFLYHVISSILFYTNPVTSFYIFFVSTSSFRSQVRNLFRFNCTSATFFRKFRTSQ